MKIMDRNGRLFGKVSIIDVVVVVVVLVLALALNMKKNHLSHTSTSMPNNTITYQFIVQGARSYYDNAIQVGDSLYDLDRTSGGSIGKIVAIEELPGERLAEFIDGTIEIVPIEDSVNYRITAQGEGIVSDGRILLNRIYDIGINSARNYYTKYAQFVGTITDIQVQ